LGLHFTLTTKTYHSGNKYCTWCDVEWLAHAVIENARLRRLIQVFSAFNRTQQDLVMECLPPQYLQDFARVKHSPVQVEAAESEADDASMGVDEFTPEGSPASSDALELKIMIPDINIEKRKARMEWHQKTFGPYPPEMVELPPVALVHMPNPETFLIRRSAYVD
jgi:hypothetical protein